MSNARFHLRFLLWTIFGFTLCACGKSSKKTTSAAQLEEAPGVYWAYLHAVNDQTTRDLLGSAKVSHFGDEFTVRVELKNAPAVPHIQALMQGDRCPTRADDRNGDGYVDGYEALRTSGLLLVPFDEDLSAQSRGFTFPRGSYVYRESSSYALLLSDLHLYDEVFNDALAKLVGGDLPLAGKVVMVFGVSQDLPSSVSGFDGHSPAASLPIACGTLALISDVPESSDAPPRIEPSRPRVPEPAPDRPRRRTYDPGSEEPQEPNPDRSGTWWGNTRRRVGNWWCRLRRCRPLAEI